MEKILAYIDESGDPHFNEGASSRLEFSAILIESSEENNIIEQLSQIQKKLKIPEFKSRNIKNEERRIELLESIQEIDFKFINLSIDKSKVYGDWKNFPKVFYKYTQKILHSELHRLYPDRTVTIDKFGDEQYQNSLRQYLEKNIQLELFDNVVNTGSAKNNLLIQLADLIAGTYRKSILGDFKNIHDIFVLLKRKELHLLKWPDNYQRLVIESIDNEQDRIIAQISISYAERYIDEHRGDRKYEHKISVLEYLLFQVKFSNYKRYIYSNELICWLGQENINYNEEDFRREIIGQLRDEGIVIVGSRKGLKIPMALEELVDYLNYTSSRYLTMIKRFKETYKTLNASSLGNIDVFNSKEFEIHKEIFKILDRF
ncbi:MAG: DUF3800 domain-containing protein [Candidatus Delongbacteria bacterium]|nr:DUF3800 domain-containing protein [Candidatus Delongbacteria bacterium]